MSPLTNAGACWSQSLMDSTVSRNNNTVYIRPLIISAAKSNRLYKEGGRINDAYPGQLEVAVFNNYATCLLKQLVPVMDTDNGLVDPA